MELGVLTDWVDTMDWVREALDSGGVWIDPTSGGLLCLVEFASVLYLLSSLVTMGGLKSLWEKLGLSQTLFEQYHETSVPCSSSSS
jgi:hypothetical protein